MRIGVSLAFVRAPNANETFSAFAPRLTPPFAASGFGWLFTVTERISSDSKASPNVGGSPATIIPRKIPQIATTSNGIGYLLLAMRRNVEAGKQTFTN